MKLALSYIIFLLKASRPGLWFPAVWLYLLPLSREYFWEDYQFWAGLIFVCFPLNLLVYGWNDRVDRETDRLNPRKDSFLFGARGTDEELDALPKYMFSLFALAAAVFVFWEGWIMLLLFAGLFLSLFLYNHPKWGWRGRPPLELVCQIGYLLLVPFSILLNEVNDISWVTYLYLFLFAVQSQLIGEVMDIRPDREAGRKTTATELGITKTKWLIIFVVAFETGLLFFYYQDFIFGGMLAAALVWLLLDLLIIYKNKEYTLFQMQLFGIGSNFIALGSMIYVWWSGCLF